MSPCALDGVVTVDFRTDPEQSGELRTGAALGSDAPGTTTLRCGQPWVLSFLSYIGLQARIHNNTHMARARERMEEQGIKYLTEQTDS